MKSFEFVTEDEALRGRFCSLRWMGRVTPYVWKFREIQFRLPTMTKEEAHSTFMVGFTPHIVE